MAEKLRLSQLPSAVVREANKQNTMRAKRLRAMMDGDQPREQITALLREDWPEHPWDRLLAPGTGKGAMPPTKTAETEMVPVDTPPSEAAEAEVAEVAEATSSQWPAVQMALHVTGASDQGKVQDNSILKACEVAFRETAVNDGRGKGNANRWQPRKTISHLVAHGYVAGDPAYIEEQFIRYVSGERLRDVRLGREMTLKALSDQLSEYGVTLSANQISRTEEGGTPLLWGDRLTGLAFVLGVPEEVLTGEAPLPVPLPTTTDAKQPTHHPRPEPEPEPEPPRLTPPPTMPPPPTDSARAVVSAASDILKAVAAECSLNRRDCSAVANVLFQPVLTRENVTPETRRTFAKIAVDADERVLSGSLVQLAKALASLEDTCHYYRERASEAAKGEDALREAKGLREEVERLQKLAERQKLVIEQQQETIRRLTEDPAA